MSFSRTNLRNRQESTSTERRKLDRQGTPRGPSKEMPPPCDKLGLKVRVYEGGETVGGTWYWNRYPGARCDSDSYVYCFTWDRQLWQEWEWSERYPEQPEIFRYLEHVTERHDLKRDIQFNTRVTGAEFDETSNLWKVHTDNGEEITARYLIDAVGTLSDTNMP